MRVVEVRGTDGFGALHVVQRPTPPVGPSDVLIRMCFASLNYRDLMLPLGTHPRASDYVGRIPLSDGAGEVVAVGERVTRVAPGDRVTVSTKIGWIDGPYRGEYYGADPGFTIDGVLAEYAVFDQMGVLRLPDYLSYAEAAALPCAAVSAWAALTGSTAPTLPGQTVLVQGTGGVSLFALQFAKLLGARVLAITSTAAKADLLRGLGAEAVVNYRHDPDWHLRVLELTEGRGVDRAVDVVGGQTVERAARCTRIGGLISCVGFLGGREGGIDSITLVGRALQVSGYAMGSRAQFEQMLLAMQRYQVHPVLDQTFDLTEVTAAYERLSVAGHVGKIIIRVGP